VACISANGGKGHINNLYNTTFWALIQLGGMDAKSAEKELAVSQKREYGREEASNVKRERWHRIRMRFYSRGSRLIIIKSPRFGRREVWFLRMLVSPPVVLPPRRYVVEHMLIGNSMSW
jgi:hypothetical protein